MAVALGGRTALLVLDGAERADNLPRLLDRCSALTAVLITSRDADDVYEEEIAVSEFNREEAVSLLQEWGGARAANPEEAGAICDLVGDLPLAVALAGKYIRRKKRTAAAYLQWLRDEGLGALDHGHRRRDSVPLLLDRSLDEVALLAPEARDIVAVLGVLALAPVSEAALVAALDDGSVTICAARWMSWSATGCCAYRRTASWADTYQLAHALLHQYAGERMDVAPAALERLASYYNRFARTHREEGLPGYTLPRHRPPPHHGPAAPPGSGRTVVGAQSTGLGHRGLSRCARLQRRSGEGAALSAWPRRAPSARAGTRAATWAIWASPTTTSARSSTAIDHSPAGPGHLP